MPRHIASGFDLLDRITRGSGVISACDRITYGDAMRIRAIVNDDDSDTMADVVRERAGEPIAAITMLTDDDAYTCAVHVCEPPTACAERITIVTPPSIAATWSPHRD